MFEGSFQGVSRTYQGSFKGVLRKIEGCSESPLSGIQGIFMVCKTKFIGCFKAVAKMF